MTRYLIDVASYQGSLSPKAVRDAGYSAVNLKISHGLTRVSVHPDVAGWVMAARSLGLGVSTFHYFTSEAPGVAQAEYAYARIAELGLLYGTAHQMDVESSFPPLLAEVRAYLQRMTTLLARPVALYTGDWWWTARAGWNVSDLTPYLWAAPNRGYVGTYPTDESPHWDAGYGGWPSLSVMQFGVGPLPGGTIDVSKSAIRDETVWRDLTTGRPGMSYVPDSLADARTLYITSLKRAGYVIDPLSVGIKGDDSHTQSGTSYHLGKDALKVGSYSVVESPRDGHPTNAAMALDLGWFEITVDGKRHNLRTFSVWLVAQCRAGTADTADIREVIYSDDGKVVKRWDRLGRRTTGESSHLTHTHESWFRDSEARDKTAHLRRYFTEIGVLEGEDMTKDEFIAMLADPKFRAAYSTAIRAADVRAALCSAVMGTDGVIPAPGTPVPGSKNPDGTEVNAFWGGSGYLQQIFAKASAAATGVGQLVPLAQAEAAEVPPSAQENAAAVLAALGSAGTNDAEVAAVLAAVLGSRAGAVGAILAGGA